MLLGTFEETMASTGQVLIPEQFRTDLAASILVCGFDRCLNLLTPASWHSLVQRIGQAVPDRSEQRRLRRVIFASAAEVIPDEAGHIVIPPHLRTFAGLGERVVFAGLYSYVELWSQERWQGVMGALDESASAMKEMFVNTMQEASNEHLIPEHWLRASPPAGAPRPALPQYQVLEQHHGSSG
jgi:MraZ protein